MSQKAEVMDGSSAARVVGASPGPIPPAASYGFSSEIVVLSDPRGVRAEAVRTLRTHIMARHVEDGRRGLAICAASDGVGATFTAVNLSIALAQIGVKVLLIDGDLRRAEVETFIRPPTPVKGLLQYLEDEDLDVSAMIQTDVIEGLPMMFAGGVSGRAQELLASDRFADLVERCLRDYDLTIIDSPPANGCADGRRISTVVGYSLIVAKRHQSFVDDIKALALQLHEDRAEIIGTVLNES